MYDSDQTGTEWIEGFSLFAGCLWLFGALFIGAMVLIGNSGAIDSSVTAASNQTPVADSPQTE